MNIFLLELYPGSVEKNLEQHFENQEGKCNALKIKVNCSVHAEKSKSKAATKRVKILIVAL